MTSSSHCTSQHCLCFTWTERNVTSRDKLVHNRKDIPWCGMNFTEIIQKSLSAQSLGALLLVKKYWSTASATACRNNIISAFLLISKNLLQVFSLTHLDIRNKALNLGSWNHRQKSHLIQVLMRIPISQAWELWNIKPKDLQPIGTCSNPLVLEWKGKFGVQWLNYSCMKLLQKFRNSRILTHATE